MSAPAGIRANWYVVAYATAGNRRTNFRTCGAARAYKAELGRAGVPAEWFIYPLNARPLIGAPEGGIPAGG